MTRIMPTSDRLLVEPQPDPLKTRSGLYLPEQAKDRPMVGTVIAVGPGKITDQGIEISQDFEPGDKVLFGRYAGTEVVVDDVHYLMMRGDDILAWVVEDSAPVTPESS